MSKRPRKGPTKIFVDAKRLNKKVAEWIQGERDMSKASASSFTEMGPAYFDQYSERKSKIASAPKKKKGIWRGTLELLQNDPDIGAEATWQNLGGYQVEDPDTATEEWFRWEMWLEDDRLFQLDIHTGKTTDIGFKAFDRWDFAEAKKELKKPQNL